MIECNIENAPKFLEWCKTRGGIAKWQSINLSNPGASWSTPALTPEGLPTPRPTWQADEKPIEVESNPDKITVYVDREVKRFHVAVKLGDSFNFVLTDASDRRVKREVEKAGKGAYYAFDYMFQDCVIMAPDKQMTLTEWAKASELVEPASQ